MASACVNNNIGVSPETFSPVTYSSYGWLSPRISLSSDLPNDNDHEQNDTKTPPADPQAADPEEPPMDPADFEFRLEDYPSAMLPADKLFSGGKLVPLHLSASPIKTSLHAQTSPAKAAAPAAPAMKSRRRDDLAGVSVSGNDLYLFSPKAPRCSSRWRELLGLKKLSANPKVTAESHKTTPSLSSSAPSKALKNFLHRSSKSYSSSSSSSSSSSDHSSLILPLLLTKESSDSFESVSISSSRLSLSSSSSGHDHDDLPRHSLDFPETKPSISLHRNPGNPHPRIRTAKPRSAMAVSDHNRAGRSPIRARGSEEATAASRGVAVDSPRMNSSGKIVFQSLERSSSSPSSFNGGPRFKHRGMERSYSANVRVVTPVLNVPVCSLRVGFGQLFSSPQKRSDGSNIGARAHSTHSTHRNRTERN